MSSLGEIEMLAAVYYNVQVASLALLAQLLLP